MSDYEEISPGTELINAIRAEKSPYHSWAGEVIDNALDAQASIVNLDMTKEGLVCRDNGIGVAKKNDEVIVKISGHGEMSGTKLGRFGVGLKMKSIQHGRSLHIQSVSKDGRLRRTVDWEHILRSGRWIYPVKTRAGVPVGTPTGTSVSIRGLITKPPTKADIDRTRDEISRKYYPALATGTIIILNGEAIAPVPQPLLRDTVEATLTFPGGRSARVRGGMLVDPSSAKLKQVDVCVAYRVIKPGCSLGCDGYGGIRSMHARIDLVGPWKLTKFKDDLAEDPFQDELETAVEDVLRPILERCQSENMYLKTKNLEIMINDRIPVDQRLTRPDKKQDLGRKGDKRGDKTIKDAPDSNPSLSGPTKKKKPQRGLLIEFAPDLHEKHGFGRAQVGSKSTRIQLATDNPVIFELMSQRDQQVAATALLAIAALIYEADLAQATPNLFNEPVGLRASMLTCQEKIHQSAEAA